MVYAMYEIITNSKKSKNIIGDTTIIIDGRFQINNISMIQNGFDDTGVFLTFPSVERAHFNVISKDYMKAFTNAAYLSLKHHGEPYYLHIFENQLEPQSYLDMMDRIQYGRSIPESLRNLVPVEPDPFSYGTSEFRYKIASIYQRYYGNGINHLERYDIRPDQSSKEHFSMQFSDAIICSGIDLSDKRALGSYKLLNQDFKAEVKAKIKQQQEKLHEKRENKFSR